MASKNEKDPWGTTADANAGDPFDSAPPPPPPDRIKLGDMAKCVVLVTPLRVEWAESTQKGKEGDKYKRVTANVTVLKGELPLTPDKQERELPYVVSELYVTGSAADQLDAAMKNGTAMVLARVVLGGNNGKRIILDGPAESDKQLARAYLAGQTDPFAG